MKIENKISRILEIVLLAIAVVVSVLFFAGGSFEGTDEYVYTDLLLNSTFALAAIAVVTTFVLSLVNFVKNLLHEPKKSLKSLLGPLGIIVIVYVSYLFADATPLDLPGYDGDSNQGGWLISADVILFTTYVMTAITTAVTIITGTIKSFR